MRIMIVNDLDNNQTWNEIVDPIDGDSKTLTLFLGESSLAHYSVTFQDYIPVSSDQAKFEKKNEILETRVAELVEELSGRNREIDRLSEDIATKTGQLDKVVTEAVGNRDQIRTLQVENDLLRGENHDLKDHATTYSIPIPLPTPPRAMRST